MIKATNSPNTNRILSIDFLRGLVMVIMALDHVRDFFHYDAYFFDPSDVTQTNPALFLTRFLTHFCAPVFVFLAGTSAFFVGERIGKPALAKWLLKRGLWLIVVELTIMKLAWNFKLDYSIILFQVIWVLGAAMLFLAAFIYVPKKMMIAISLLVVFGHNAFDGFNPQHWTGLWTLLHVQAPISLGNIMLFNAYPLIPWVFVMPLGYHFGRLYQKGYDAQMRLIVLRYIGIGMIALFFILRFINIYGNLAPWSVQPSPIFTVLSFFNITKYPPSLLFLLATLGPSILLLSYAEGWKGKIYNALVTIGRVPMFFYIVHIFVIHLLAVVAAMATGFSPKLMVIDLFVTLTPGLQGYGFPLWAVYIIWVAVVLAHYPLCKWYWNYKSNHRQKWWLSYL